MTYLIPTCTVYTTTSHWPGNDITNMYCIEITVTLQRRQYNSQWNNRYCRIKNKLQPRQWYNQHVIYKRRYQIKCSRPDSGITFIRSTQSKAWKVKQCIHDIKLGIRNVIIHSYKDLLVWFLITGLYPRVKCIVFQL